MAAVGGRQSQWSAHAAYAACAWALLFAAFSFYYALGGTAGVDVQAAVIQERVKGGDLTVELWVTGGLKILAALVALALVRPWGRRIPRRILLAAAWGAGALIALYGALGLIQAVLWATGVHDVPAQVGPRAARWKFFFDPYWLLGGVLFLLAARQFSQSSAPDAAQARPGVT